MEIIGRKSWLAKTNNPPNGHGIFIKERLPRVKRDIKERAECLGLITTTFNCKVKNFKKTTESALFQCRFKQY